MNSELIALTFKGLRRRWKEAVRVIAVVMISFMELLELTTLMVEQITIHFLQEVERMLWLVEVEMIYLKLIIMLLELTIQLNLVE